MTKGLKRGLAALVLAPLLYALLGFLLLPWVGLKLANQTLAEYASVPARLERIELNPFSLELTLHGLHLGEHGDEQLSFARLYADLQLDGLWQGALHLRELHLEQPRVELRIDADGQLNLSQLLRLPAHDPPSTEPGPPFPLRLDLLRLSGGVLGYVDQRQQPAIAHRYDSLELTLTNLTSHGGEEAELQLRATGPQGAALDWQGQLGLQPLRSRGHLSLGETDLPRWWPYLQTLLPHQLQAGTASLSSGYRLDTDGGLRLQLHAPRLQLGGVRLNEADGRTLCELHQLSLAGSRLELRPGTQPQLTLDGGQLSLEALRLHAPDGQTQLRLANLEIADARLDLAARQLLIGRLRSRELESRAVREADGRLDWQMLLERQMTALQRHRDTSRRPSEATAAPAPAAPWQVRLADVQLRGWRARLEDRVAQPAVPLDVGPLDLDLQGFASTGAAPFTLRLASGVGARGQLEARGQVQLGPFASRLAVQAHDLDLRLLQAYLSPFAHLELRSGLLAADLAVELQDSSPLALRIAGKAEVSQLHTLDTLRERDFVRWQALSLEGLDYRHGEQLRIGSVRLQQPYARFILNEDLSTNLQELLITPPPRPGPAPAEPPLHLVIGGVEIVDGSANFADFSLTPDFATALQQLNGHIGSLDNRSGQPASVAIRGKVDRYAPVSIEGQLTPFAPLEQLDIATRFRRVELTTLTPYAGKFAGYKIRKGRLNLDLHYRISRGQLDADNRVLLEDLQLGERVDSPSATDLPVRLAVALLKDSDGNIDIALPLQGNLHNPEFSMTPIVWQSLRNLMLRAVQAPFRLIGGLAAAGDEPLDSVPFAAGASALGETAQASLGTLAQALRQRPTLRLEVEGLSLQAADGPPLAEQRLQREFRDTWYRMLQRRGDRVPADASQLAVPEEMQGALLEGIYRARLKQQPPAAWAVLAPRERAAHLRQALLDSWAQSPLLLRQLAQDRARAIKAWLVDQGGLADQRIYLLEVGSATAAGAEGQISVPLYLNSE